MSLFLEYKSSLKNGAIEEFVDLFFFRPMAFLFVKSVYRSNITPNQITVASILVGTGSGILLGIGDHATIALGGILLVAANILDCADGQLARLKGNGTPLGRILDGAGDYVYTVAAFIGMGVGGKVGGFDPVWWWIFVVTAGLSYALQAALLDFYRNEYLAHARGEIGFIENELGEIRNEYEKYVRGGGHRFERILLSVYLRYSSSQKSLKKRGTRESSASPSDYVKRNRVMIRLWSLNGTSTHIVVFAFCAWASRIDIFLWYIVGFGSIYSLVLYGVQKLIDRTVPQT